MKKILLFWIIFMFIFTSLVAISVQSENTIRKALKMYKAMHLGNYKIKCTGTSISNNMNILHIEILVLSNRFKSEISFPIQKQKDKKNSISFLLGQIYGIQYSRKLLQNIGIIGGISFLEKEQLFYTGVRWNW